MVIRNSKRKGVIRRKMVGRYLEIRNYSQVARKTVARWIERYDKKGPERLKDKSWTPNSISQKTPEDIEEEIEEIVSGKKLAIG